MPVHQMSMHWLAGYIYDNLDVFKLILYKSEGTAYNHLVEEMAAREVQATVASIVLP